MRTDINKNKFVSKILNVRKNRGMLVYGVRFKGDRKMYEQTKDGLEAIESMVKGPWIMGNKITQADVSLVCFLDFIVKHRPETAPQLNCPNLEKISKKANLMVEFSSTIPT